MIRTGISHEDAGINHDHYLYGIPKDVMQGERQMGGCPAVAG